MIFGVGEAVVGILVVGYDVGCIDGCIDGQELGCCDGWDSG